MIRFCPVCKRKLTPRKDLETPILPDNWFECPRCKWMWGLGGFALPEEDQKEASPE